MNSTRAANIAREGDQAMPLTGYYAGESIDDRDWTSRAHFSPEILNNPLRQMVVASPVKPAEHPSDELPTAQKKETIEKARIVFGSRLTGPERKSEIQSASTNIAGVLVPPRPTEPDNCCMSGCVNCVWDLYRDEMEEWAAKSAEARARIEEQRASGQATGTMATASDTPSHVATSMDDDGGGSEANWTSQTELGGQPADLFQGIPVGIREFMKTEKMLKERHTQGESVGA
jgi:predicted  nucleic acid-binding Zn-ribbon protein